MASIDLGPHFDRFIQQQIDDKHFETATDVIQAGLSLLEERERSHVDHRTALEQELKLAFDDRCGRPAEDVFDDIEARFAADTLAKA